MSVYKCVREWVCEYVCVYIWVCECAVSVCVRVYMNLWECMREWVCECVCARTHSVHHFTPSPVLSESYQALWDSVMDALEGMREAPFLFGKHEAGQVTFAEAVGRLTREQCWTFAADVPLQAFWWASHHAVEPQMFLRRPGSSKNV